MKRVCVYLVFVVLFFSLTAAAHGFESSALRGKSYDIFLFSTGSIEDYCNAFSIKTDTLSFSENSFRFEGVQGIPVKNSFNESFFVFDGIYETTYLVNGYKFTVSGFNLADIMIAGTVNMRYYELVIDITDPYRLKQEETAFFWGVRK